MKWCLTFIDEVFVQYILVIVCSQTKKKKNKKRKLTKIQKYTNYNFMIFIFD